MKKKLAAILAGVMVLTMGMATVFASVSPSVSDDGQASADALSETGSAQGLGSVDLGTVTANEDDGTYSIAVDTADAEELGLVDGQTYYLYIEGVAVVATYSEEDGCFIVDAADIDLEDGADISYEVYEDYVEEESSEEPSETEEPSEDSTASTESDSTSDDGTTTSGDGATTSTDASPKTGAAAALPLLAVAALAGVVVCGKKVKFYE